MPDYSFPKTYRLRRQKDFDRVFSAKCRAADEWIAVYAWANELDHPRLGICASSRLGNAVTRNRWKRMIREAFRLSKGRLPAGLDLVVIPQADVCPPLQTLQASLWRLSRRLKQKVQTQKARLQQEAGSDKGVEKPSSFQKP
ncbi:MAG: ribonuclease P protein component [Thermoguttaceae bacterium]|nr:ribonuclease P protein component [Thermoguttaceae bacterium]MDW8038450.1 ribonuclease P protein component [Thermoguttaceae bacterium]